MKPRDIFSARVKWTVNKRLEWRVSCSVKVDFAQVFTGGQSVVVDPWMLDVSAVLTIEDWGEGDDLVDGAVVFHLDQGLELLDNTTISGENVVLHVGFTQKVTLVFQMADDFDLVAAFRATFDCVVEDWAVEPCAVVKDNFSALLLVIDCVC